MPWRNGRGSTLEIAREPAAGEEFAWRLSLAAITADGDFSVYRGYRRAIVLVSGNGLRLRFRGHGSASLNPTRRGARFEGDWKTHCAVPEGSCTDLSLIVRDGSGSRPACIVRAPLIRRIEATRRVILSADLYGAIFVLAGATAVKEPKSVRPRRLRARDTLLLSPGASRVVTLQNRGRYPAQIAFLSWRPAADGPRSARGSARLRAKTGG